jgi:uncharacterized protein (TIGR02646 family)
VKRCPKLPEPASLTAYRTAQPNGTWEQMQNDPFYGGQQAYAEIKPTLVRGQRGLCAYCERRISSGLADEELNMSRPRQRVEHFHPKSDVGGLINWALHWPNLWAVCTGGNQAPPAGEHADPAEYLAPTPENSSCDAFKDRQIQIGQLNLSPEGQILAPHELPAFPRLFKYAWDGSMEPDTETCITFVAPNNHHPDTVTLVRETIKNLNLNCGRLSGVRYVVRKKLEDIIAQIRLQNAHVNPQLLLRTLAQRLLSNNPNSMWTEFFTLIRWRLGQVAEEHLQATGFTG